MKIPQFTADPNVRDESAYEEHRVLSREETTLSRRSRDWFPSRQAFLQHGEQYEKRKFIIGKYLAEYLKSLSTRSVLGLGSGECYHEYAMKLANPEIKITATDFDPFVVEKVSEFLPEIDKVEVFDFKKDDFAKFQGKYGTILIVHSEYVLSDDELISFFKRVSIVGASHIIIMSACYLTSSKIFRHILTLPLSRLKRFVLRKAQQGRFHGWARSKGEFTKLMRMAGTLKLQKVITGEPFTESQAMLHIVPRTQPEEV